MDPERATENSPTGKTIAFGWLTTSLTTPMIYEVFRHDLHGDRVTYGYPLSYGFNRMRLVAPVEVDSEFRGRIILKDVEDRGQDRVIYTFDITVERKGEDKPALVAEYLLMWLKDKPANESAGLNA